MKDDPPPRRFMGIDPGDKRTGLAMGDLVTGITTPVGVIVTTDPAERLRQILKAIEEHEPQAVVVGLAINMDGSEGPAARRSRALADEISHAGEVTVHLFDERLTSYAADQQMARTGMTHRRKKDLRDALAAATILSDFFAAQANANRDDAANEE